MAVAAAVAITGASRAETTKKQAPCVAPQTVAQTMAGRPPCFLGETRVTTVRPYYGSLQPGVAQLLEGAKLELVPEYGLSAQDLEARVQQALQAGQREPLPACLIDVGRVHIESNAVGDASSVTLIAKDPKDAEQILERANQLLK
jgi:hypothetical protein